MLQRHDDAYFGDHKRKKVHVSPDLHVRVVSPTTQKFADVPADSQALLVNVQGRPVEPDSLFFEFLEQGVDMNVALGEALKVLCRDVLKSQLRQVLKYKQYTQLRPILLFLLESWLKVQEMHGSTSNSDSTSNSNSRKDALERESFDAVVVAFLYFREHPEVFKYPSASHATIVKKLTDVFKEVFETVLLDKQDEQRGVADMSTAQQRTLDEETLTTLFNECSATLDLREARNGLSCCFDTKNLQLARRVLELLRKASDQHHVLLRKVQKLTACAIDYLESNLALNIKVEVPLIGPGPPVPVEEEVAL